MAKPTNELKFVSEIELKKMKNNKNLKNLSSISFRLRHWFSDYQDKHCTGTTNILEQYFLLYYLSINQPTDRYFSMVWSGPYNKEYLSAP